MSFTHSAGAAPAPRIPPALAQRLPPLVDEIAAQAWAALTPPHGIWLADAPVRCRFQVNGTVICSPPTGAVGIYVQRSHDYQHGRWFGHETRRDALGRKWERTLSMVCNDFGDLVEVDR